MRKKVLNGKEKIMLKAALNGISAHRPY